MTFLSLAFGLVVSIFAIEEVKDVASGYSQCEPTQEACVCTYSPKFQREHCDWVCPLEDPECQPSGRYPASTESVLSSVAKF